jgi:hypothetical protein
LMPRGALESHQNVDRRQGNISHKGLFRKRTI